MEGVKSCDNSVLGEAQRSVMLYCNKNAYQHYVALLEFAFFHVSIWLIYIRSYGHLKIVKCIAMY